MIFESKTIEVLKNFSTINNSIRFPEGNIIRVMSPRGTIVAKAKIPNSFDKEFCIWDTARLISAISIIPNANIKLNETNLEIYNDKSKIRYFYADPILIKTPKDKDIIIPHIDVQFQMKNEVFTSVLKALSVLELSELAIIGEDGKLFFSGVDSTGKNTDNYRVNVGDTNKTFSIIFKLENLKLLPQDYNVSVCFDDRGILSHFVGDNVEYWVAVDSNSTIEK